MSFVDLSLEACHEVQVHSGVLLRHVSVGSPLVPNLFRRIPRIRQAGSRPIGSSTAFFVAILSSDSSGSISIIMIAISSAVIAIVILIYCSEIIF